LTENRRRTAGSSGRDPFREKLLLEACLELLATDAVAGIQDMGAAGLTCSTCETASAVAPAWKSIWQSAEREEGMTPYEIMLASRKSAVGQSFLSSHSS